MTTFLHRRKKGFTLIEMAVVLVVVSLLVGGVFVGQEMVRQAEIRSMMTELGEMKASLQTFKDKYLQLPGDFDDAEALWGADTGCPATSWSATPKKATCNGNGDNFISLWDHDGSTQTEAYESFRAWQQLANAGLMPGAYCGMAGPSGSGNDSQLGINTPGSRIGGVGYSLFGLKCYACYPGSDPLANSYFYLDYKNIIQAGLRGVDPNDYYSEGFLTPEELYNVDLKMDDGKPGSGVITERPIRTGCITGTAAAPGDAVYNVGNKVRECGVVFITGM